MLNISFLPSIQNFIYIQTGGDSVLCEFGLFIFLKNLFSSTIFYFVLEHSKVIQEVATIVNNKINYLNNINFCLHSFNVIDDRLPLFG